MGKKTKRKSYSGWLIFAGLFILIAAVFLLKEKPKAPAIQAAGETPQIQLERALEAGQPVLAFYHSNNCQSCIDMIAVVNQIYPEFSDDVILVDVDVYDTRNQPLLKAVGLRYIPTQMLYDRSGSKQTVVGVMQPDQLREALAAIRQGK
jgi:thiol-disulfide isomerase/thioredoxin